MTDPAHDDTQRRAWRADFDKVAAALEPWAREVHGFAHIDPAAPTDLTRIYAALTHMGYAHGWL